MKGFVMTSQERTQKIAVFVTGHLVEMAHKYPAPEHDPVYRWEHTLRVAHYGQQIAQAEEADIDVVVAACLLHDVAHFDPLENYKVNLEWNIHIQQAAMILMVTK